MVYITNRSRSIISFGFLANNDKIILPFCYPLRGSGPVAKVQRGSGFPRVFDNYHYIVENQSYRLDFVTAKVITST